VALELADRAVSFHLDTHVALWMAAGDARRRLKPIEAMLRKGRLYLSPLAILELQFLFELGRLGTRVEEVVGVLFEDHGVEEAPGDLREIGRQVQGLTWTRDPFDRLIVAHAIAHGSVLLTADETILAHCPRARWG